MRTFLIVYCVLTLIFAGGCALIMYGLSGSDFPGAETDPILFVLLFACVANVAFIVMAANPGARGGNLLMSAGVIYAILQAFLFLSMSGPADLLVTVLALSLFGLKALVVAITGKYYGKYA